MVKIGFEQEFSLKNSQGEYLDCSNTTYEMLRPVVEAFPVIPEDAQVFDCKSLETEPRRCYVEGVERYDESGTLIATDPKGLELRTMPHTDMHALMDEFRSSFKTMTLLAERQGLYPLLVSRNPFSSEARLQTPFNRVELAKRTDAELSIALRAMLTHGFHINVSVEGYDLRQTQDLAEKINCYMPYLIPYTFSSPFVDGELTEFQSTRMLMRASKRQLVGIDNRKGAHVIQFRGFDPVGRVAVLRAVLFLTRGLALDQKLNGRSESQNAEMLEQVCKFGLDSPTIKAAALEVLNAVQAALGSDGREIDPLFEMLYGEPTESMRIRQNYLECGDIIGSVSDMYEF